MSDEPPLKNRPTWKATTMVDPKEKVSGSTSVRCMLVEFVNGSELIRVSAVFAATALPDTAITSPEAIASAGPSLFMCTPPYGLFDHE